MLKSRSFLAFGIILVILIFYIIAFISKNPSVNTKYTNSMINLRDIGVALKEYAEDNDGNLPDSFEQLEVFENRHVIFESPLKPENFNDTSYIYISGHSLNVSKLDAKKYILAYENPVYCAKYMNDTNIPFIALFLEGRVERLKKERFVSSLKETYEYLGREMPEIRFAD